MIARALLAASGAALAASLFLHWFDREAVFGAATDPVTGWEHWAWADVPLALLAAALVAAAIRPPPTPIRIALATLCALGIAVVLGHGLEPRSGLIGDVGPGAYVALGALAAALVGAVARWPRRGGALLLFAGAVGLAVALFVDWNDGSAVSYVPLDSDENSETMWTEYGPQVTGFERWQVLDVGFLVLAAGLLAVAFGWRSRVLRAVLAIASLAAAACLVVADDAQFRMGDGGAAQGKSLGWLLAMLALAAALGGLALAGQSQTSAPDSTRTRP